MLTPERKWGVCSKRPKFYTRILCTETASLATSLRQTDVTGKRMGCQNITPGFCNYPAPAQPASCLGIHFVSQTLTEARALGKSLLSSSLSRARLPSVPWFIWPASAHDSRPTTALPKGWQTKQALPRQRPLAGLEPGRERAWGLRMERLRQNA